RRAEEVAEVFLAHEMKPKGTAPAPVAPATAFAAQPDPAKLAAYAGDYASDELGVIYRLAISDGKLVRMAILEYGGFPRAIGPTALTASAADQFVTGQGMTLIFERNSQGQVSGFSAVAGRAKGILFTRVAKDSGR